MTRSGATDGGVLPPPTHEVPAAPLWSAPDSAGRVDADGYVWGSPSSDYVTDGADRRRSTRAVFLTPFASKAALGLCVALFAWFALLFVSSLLLVVDSDAPPAGLTEAVIGYGLCAVVVLLGMAAPGRWRAAFTAAVTLFGALLPLYLARDLVDSLGVGDVWVGQSLTFGVLFPVVVGGGATIALIRTPGWR